MHFEHLNILVIAVVFIALGAGVIVYKVQENKKRQREVKRSINETLKDVTFVKGQSNFTPIKSGPNPSFHELHGRHKHMDFEDNPLGFDHVPNQVTQAALQDAEDGKTFPVSPDLHELNESEPDAPLDLGKPELTSYPYLNGPVVGKDGRTRWMVMFKKDGKSRLLYTCFSEEVANTRLNALKETDVII